MYLFLRVSGIRIEMFYSLLPALSIGTIYLNRINLSVSAVPYQAVYSGIPRPSGSRATSYISHQEHNHEDENSSHHLRLTHFMSRTFYSYRFNLTGIYKYSVVHPNNVTQLHTEPICVRFCSTPKYLQAFEIRKHTIFKEQF